MEEKNPEPFEKEIAEFLRKLIAGDKEVALEIKLIKMMVLSLLALAFAGFFLYLFIFRAIDGFGTRMPFIGYAGVSAVVVAASIAQYRSHKLNFTCMEGMMVGMTIGMIAGFLFGAIVGATNGMFIGSVFGMAVGMLAGAWCGKCCGIMGVMEGMMAGLMGGTMGAMLSVMMLNDNLEIFMAIFVTSCLSILAGLAYMVHVTAGRRDAGNLMGFGHFLLLSLLLAAATIAIILFAPRSALVA